MLGVLLLVLCALVLPRELLVIVNDRHLDRSVRVKVLPHFLTSFVRVLKRLLQLHYLKLRQICFDRRGARPCNCSFTVPTS